MSAKLSSQVQAEPNLTPILDMVFQLITFFMLVINFKSAALDLSLKLPVVGSARPVDSKGLAELLILNVDKTGEIINYGVHKKDIEDYIAKEALTSVVAARLNDASFQFGDELPTTVVIRADKATPFKLLYRVIKACQNNGYRKFALKAITKREA
jgi:biopolymer transport protein ExbD